MNEMFIRFTGTGICRHILQTSILSNMTLLPSKKSDNSTTQNPSMRLLNVISNCEVCYNAYNFGKRLKTLKGFIPYE